MTHSIPRVPIIEHTFDAFIDVDVRKDLGTSASGQRFIVDILGGTFEGPRLRGRVLKGGADRQVWRTDGVQELDALFEMETHDGSIITVRNRVLIDDPSRDPLSTSGRYARSNVTLTAPTGPYGWLNRRIFVGTVNTLLPERQAVRVGVYLVR